MLLIKKEHISFDLVGPFQDVMPSQGYLLHTASTKLPTRGMSVDIIVFLSYRVYHEPGGLYYLSVAKMESKTSVLSCFFAFIDLQSYSTVAEIMVKLAVPIRFVSFIVSC